MSDEMKDDLQDNQAPDLAAPEPAAPEALSDEARAEALRLLEAVLFASAEPLSLDVVRQHGLDLPELGELIDELRQSYEGHGVMLVETGGLWSFRTAPDLAARMKMVRPVRRKLPKAASEVLAIIAYHQPVTRGEIESIRGVETSRGTLDILLELGWIRPGKRKETPGRPLTWKTTPDFLSAFNLSSLAELPGMDDLKAAGLLDARPVLAQLPQEGAPPEEDDFADLAEGE